MRKLPRRDSQIASLFPPSDGTLDAWSEQAAALLRTADQEIQKAASLRDRIQRQRLEAENIRYHTDQRIEEAVSASVGMQVESREKIRAELSLVDEQLAIEGQSNIVGMEAIADANSQIHRATLSLATRTQRPRSEMVRDDVELGLEEEWNAVQGVGGKVTEQRAKRQMDLQKHLDRRNELLAKDVKHLGKLMKHATTLRATRLNSTCLASVDSNVWSSSLSLPRMSFRSTGGTILGKHSGSWTAR
jgi:hypothetical protein